MSNTAKQEAIEAAAKLAGVSVKFYNSRSCALGRGNVGEPDKCTVSGGAAELARFRNELNRSEAMKGSKITKTQASAGYWNLGVACDVSYFRTVTL